ncbi:MAG: hypothetical protein R3F20_16300 [Planctomycetota bacterium]
MKGAIAMKRFRVNHTFDAPGPSPYGLAWDGQHLWVSDKKESRIYKVNPENGQALLTIPFEGDLAGCAWDGKHFWQADDRTKTVCQIDAENGKILLALACDLGDAHFGGICHDGHDLWIAVRGGAQLRRVRTEDGAILKTHPVEDNISGLGHDHRRVWYTEEGNAKIRVVDPNTGTELMSYELEGQPTGVAFTGRREFWFANAETGKIQHVTLMPRS